MHDHALGIARAGYRVVPLPAGMKAPPPKDWPTLATSDLTTVSRWWTEHPQANIAIVSGNGVLVLDVDPRHGGNATLASLQLQWGPLPATLTVRTPSGGLHLYFAGPDVGNSAGKIGPGLDIKSRGGYVVAPPSRTVAISGEQFEGRYEWVDVSVAPAQAPQWLIEAAGATKAPAVPVPTATMLKLRSIDGEQLWDLMSALDHLTTVPNIASNTLWSQVGYALLSLEDCGREIFCEWSARAPGYTLGAPERWWDSHRSESARSDYRRVFNIAQEHGWINPRSRTARLVLPPSLSVPVGTISTGHPPSHALTFNRRNQYEATIENLVYVLSVQQCAAIGYDEFRGRIMITQAGGNDWRPLTDTDMIQLRETFAREQRFAPISKELMSPIGI